MANQLGKGIRSGFCHLRSVAFLLVGAAVLMNAVPAFAAIPWDGEGNDGLWFNPANWNRNMNSNDILPPGNLATGVTDTEISAGTATLNGGMGVIYDPTPGPGTFFPPAASITFPVDFGAQKIRELYIGRSANPPAATPVPDNTLTIKGDLELTANMVVGRSSGSLTVPTNGRVNQLAGDVLIPLNALDLGQREGGGRIGYGNGTYDYRGGTLDVARDASDVNNHGIRLAAGGSQGTGGVGRFIMHNPATPGYVRTLNFTVAAHGGIAGNTDVSPNGSTIGVGIAEFVYENSGTRPIQVSRNLIINNGAVTTGTRSARLALTLGEAPAVNQSGVPESLGLFDVDFAFDTVNSDLFEGVISGAGDKGLFFSSADGSSLYGQDAVVSATFGSTKYNWNISYTGNITWANQQDADAGIVQSIEGTGGLDVVLIGLSSESAGLAGDFNNNGRVDAADYTLWRNNKDTNNALLNDGGLGTPIDQDHYNLWRTNFGMGTGGAGSVTAVPEPGTILMALLCVAGVVGLRRRVA
jgi:hypothetical protein